MFDMFTFLRFSQYVLYRRIRVPLQDSIDGAERVDIHASANLRLRYLGQPKMMRALKTQAYSTPLQRTTSHSVSHIQCVLISSFVSVSRSFSTKFAISGASGDRFIGHPQGVYFWCPP